MIKRIAWICVLLISISLNIQGQGRSVAGTILNTTGDALPYATAVLLDPADSTLMYYGISKEDGWFKIENVAPGGYLMQVAFIGYKTSYKTISLPRDSESNFVFALEEQKVNLGEVEVIGEAVPLLINGDTVEYKRRAYKLQEGAVVEDLLKKLPGVEVDRAGNIKAMGEDVSQVYVDGKEFFGSDPKMATKNLPAEAIDKVQVYDKKSDVAEFTGVDDGSRQKSLNLVLEEDMKKMVFGNVSAGGGLPSVYEGNLKSFYHTDKINLAALGNLNNINNPGFSFGDYMGFQGGMGSGSFRISMDDNLPVNFGQPVYGHNTSWAGGLNFSHAKDKFNRFYVSYMANSSKRDLVEDVYSRNYTSSESFEKNSSRQELKSDTAHLINIGFRSRPDSSSNFVFNTKVNLNMGGSEEEGNSTSSLSGNTINDLLSETLNVSDRKNVSGNFSYTELLIPETTILKFNGSANYYQSMNLFEYINSTTFYEPFSLVRQDQYQDNQSNGYKLNGGVTLVQKVGKLSFIEPGFSYDRSSDFLDRNLGTSGSEGMLIDSLSSVSQKISSSYLPALGLRINNDKNKFSVRVQYRMNTMDILLDEEAPMSTSYNHILPSMNYEYKFGTGKRVSLNYRTQVNEPSVLQLLPVENTIDPLYTIFGNPDLEPEYYHGINSHLFIFDEFSFTTVFAALRAGYTNNRISMSRTIDENLVQSLMPVNAGTGFDASASVDFTTPVKKLGIKVHLNLQEAYNTGLSIVNGMENDFTSFTHDVVLSIDNRVKKKWDLRTGFGFRLTDSEYSLQSNLNDQYFDLNFFGDISYTPNSRMDFSFNADVINYNQQSFGESIVVPYLKAEANYHFPKSRRATLRLSVNDILNRDRGIQRISEMNYISEIRRNILGRYAMLSLVYKLNKMEDSKGGFNIDVHKSRRR